METGVREREGDSKMLCYRFKNGGKDPQARNAGSL